MKKWFNELSKPAQMQVCLSIVSAIVCSISMIASGGATGIGWFVFLMWVIW